MFSFNTFCFNLFDTYWPKQPPIAWCLVPTGPVRCGVVCETNHSSWLPQMRFQTLQFLQVVRAVARRMSANRTVRPLPFYAVQSPRRICRVATHERLSFFALDEPVNINSKAVHGSGGIVWIATVQTCIHDDQRLPFCSPANSSVLEMASMSRIDGRIGISTRSALRLTASEI